MFITFNQTFFQETTNITLVKVTQVNFIFNIEIKHISNINKVITSKHWDFKEYDTTDILVFI